MSWIHSTFFDQIYFLFNVVGLWHITMSGTTPSFDFVELAAALSTAQNNSTKEVLQELSTCLGFLLNAAVKAGDKNCAKQLIKAGANVNFEKENFRGRSVEAFHIAAAQIYFRMGPPVPQLEDVLGAFAQQHMSCDPCELRSETHPDGIELMYIHTARRFQCPPFTCGCEQRR